MSFLADFWRIARADRTGLAGAVVVAIYVVVAIIGPYVAHVSTEQDPMKAYLSPSWHHLLGTDSFGQDVLSEVIVGTRPIMEVGVLAATITVFVGVVVGLVSGYLGGAADTAIMRVTDVVLTLPGLPLILIISSVVRTSSPVVLALILSVTAWAGLARAVRSQALSLRTSDFIEAARLQGASLTNVVGRQLLPNVGPYVAIHFLLAITGAMYAEVGLFLLGIAPVSGTNWGVMINTAMNQGALYTSKSMLYLFSPMAAIVILQVAFVYLTRVLDSLFNPRLRVQ
ncbi:ABC transporter permease [Actinopolymorpha rutila]|uniref:Peptide/nickel transport system permease protein n=1 Tax=Actinopolymorpha rutila TaxID=446787 RepID=A0A852ZGV2_9ACTN|nr:ABC transporter permease [Actinopolymorpha rutila]NYH92317.1 peptide/nickel transport system permease protein [Actinopolymorpha rutila]